MNIIRKPCKNFYPKRNGYKPLAICNHISVGTMSSMDAWFNSSGNTQASSNFGIGRDGAVHQYVDIEHAAWTQGLAREGLQYAISPIVKQMGVNPNYYFIGVEHEGYEGHGLDGNLTDAQFLSSCWVHKYSQDYVQKKWNHKIELNPYFVEGHFRIDPRRKPFCPGKNFPWSRLYAELAIANDMPFEHYEERIDYLRSKSSERASAYAFAERVQDLSNRLTDAKWGNAARAKLMLLESCMDDVGYTGEVTAEGISKRIIDIYKNSSNVKFEDEAFRKLLIGAQSAKETGIL